MPTQFQLIQMIIEVTLQQQRREKILRILIRVMTQIWVLSLLISSLMQSRSEMIKRRSMLKSLMRVRDARININLRLQQLRVVFLNHIGRFLNATQQQQQRSLKKLKLLLRKSFNIINRKKS